MSRPAVSAEHSLKDRTRFVALNLIGQEVEVQRADGVWLRGVLQATTAAQGLGVLLRWALACDAPPGTRPESSVEVAGGEVVQVRARDATLAADVEDLTGSGGGERESEEFLTDSVIGNSRGGRPQQRRPQRMPRDEQEKFGRQLQRWTPDSDERESLVTSSLESDHSGGWDQFEANRKLFGVEATFDEDAYTTRLDRSGPEYRRREAEAARIASEIKRQSSANVHVAEERGHRSDLSEEQLYGAVIRDAEELQAAGKYVVPSKRAQKSPAEKSRAEHSPAAQQPAPAPAPETSATPATEAPKDSAAGEEKPKKLSMRELLRRKKAAGTAKAFVPSAAKATAALPVKQYDASKQLSELFCAGMATVIAIASDSGASAPDPHWPGGSTPYAKVVPTSFRMLAMQSGMVAMPQPAFGFPPQMMMPFGQQPAAKPFFVMPQPMPMQQGQPQLYPPMFAPAPGGPPDGMPHYAPQFPPQQPR